MNKKNSTDIVSVEFSIYYTQYEFFIYYRYDSAL